MHLKSEDIIRLEIDYQTGEVPPPFSHIFKLKLSFEKSFVNTQFEITYTDREELSEEEIINEGFTENDDFKFVGEIPKIWQREFLSLYSSSKWSHQKMLGPEGGIKILAKDLHGKIVRSIPLNAEEWYYLTQEYIQAIYEVSKREAPLLIRYKEVESEKVWMYELTFKFSVRKIEIRINGALQELDWESAKDLLANIFLPDYDYGVAKASEPTKRGSYIDCGDGLWHDFRTGVFNLDDSFDAKGKIQEEFKKLNHMI
ncbi:MAG TPA: hypothetical protein VK957_14625 [Lunatimonas sp.]|nr:hypothetical protein [Lunatimonas sp.]